MRHPRVRAALLAIAATAGLSACADQGYGYGGVSVGYGNAGYCDPYYGCRGGYDGYGYGAYGYGDPYYGWWGDYYYPGIGFYIYDRGGSRYRWNDTYRRYWESRRGGYQNRNWNDPQWQRWDGYRTGQNGTGTWTGRTWQRSGTGTGTGTGTWNGGNRGTGGWHGGSNTSGGWHGGGRRGH